MFRAAMAKFASAFWAGFEQDRAQSEARAQPAPLTAGHPFEGMNVDEIKTVLAAAIRGAHDEGAQAERKRMGEILTVAATSPMLAFELAIGGATAAQVAAVLSRTEVNVQARLNPTEPPESTVRVLH